MAEFPTPEDPEDPIEISGSLDVSKYIYDVPTQIDSERLPSVISVIDERESVEIQLPRDVPAQAETRKELEAWVAQKREGARSGIATTLIVFFGLSLLAEFLLIGLGAFYPQANTALIKDTLLLLINSLTSIVSLALAFYFKDK
jgi:hypothetical protein